MLVTAPRDFRYGGTLYKKGDTFEAKEKHAKFLVRAMRFMAAEPELNNTKPKKRRYKRRDMTAE